MKGFTSIGLYFKPLCIQNVLPSMTGNIELALFETLRSARFETISFFFNAYILRKSSQCHNGVLI